jgi:clan AA aspartic protease (TIGR02281 family)
MKYLSYLFFLIFLITNCQPKTNSSAEKELISLLGKKKYFELRAAFSEYKDHISKEIALEIEAHLLNTFNKNVGSNATVDQLLSEYRSQLSDSTISKLLELKADNYLKLFDYKNALDVNNLNIEKYGHTLDSATMANLKNMNNIYEPLTDVQAQKVSVLKDSKIPIKRDVAGLMNVEVLINDANYDFIFDTGAGMSVIKKSFAQELGLNLLETSIDVHAATGKIVKSSLVIIDQLKFGNILVENSVFLVMEDELLEFPQIEFYPLAAIGFPIIEELNEFSITRSDTLIVNKIPSHSAYSNMRLDELSPNIYLFNGKDSLEFAFDTGATKSHFTSDYYDKYKSDIESSYKPDSVTTSSAGGSKIHASYLIDSATLYVGPRKAVMKNIQIHTDFNKTFENEYGNIGQDLIAQFDKMTMNFVDMSLQFE